MEQPIKTASEKRAIQRAIRKENMTPEEKQLHLEKRRNKHNNTPKSEEHKQQARERSQNWRDENPLNAEQKAKATQRAKEYAERKKDTGA
jgi:hypothetical protein